MSFSDAITNLINNEPLNARIRKHTGPIDSPTSVQSGEDTPAADTPGISYKILKVLAPKPNKNPKEAKALYRQLLHFNIFNAIQDYYELDIDSLVILCQYTKFEVLRAGKIVYNKDDISNNKMYLVMNGEITISPDRINIKNKAQIEDVCTPRTLRKQASQEFKQRKMTRSRFSMIKDVFKRQSTLEDVEGAISPSHKKTLSIPKVNPFVMTKLTGDFFGEQAIFGEKVRKESAYTLRTSELIIIDMESIMRARGQYKVELNSHKVLNDYVPGLNQISSLQTKDKLISLFEMMTFDKSAILTTQGERGDYLYIISEGECEAFGSWSDDTYSKRNFNDNEIQKQFRIKKNFTEKINLFVATPGSIFGEEILFDSTATYDFTVIVKSPKVTVFRIERVKYLMRFPKEAIHAMQVLNQQKKKTYLTGYSQQVKSIIERQKTLETLTVADEFTEDSISTTAKGVAQTMSNFFIRRATMQSNCALETTKGSGPQEFEKFKKKFQLYRKKTDLSKISEVSKQPYLSRTNSISDKLVMPNLKNLGDIDSFKLKFEKNTPKKPIEEKTAFKTPKVKVALPSYKKMKTISPEKSEKETEPSPEKEIAFFFKNSPRRRMNLKLTILSSYMTPHAVKNRNTAALNSEITTPLTLGKNYTPLMITSEQYSPELRTTTTLESPGLKSERSSAALSKIFFQTSLPSQQGARKRISKTVILKTQR